MSNEIYEKVEKICQKIDAYTEKDFSVKNEIKTEVYTTKIKKLINMIEKADCSTSNIRYRRRHKWKYKQW